MSIPTEVRDPTSDPAQNVGLAALDSLARAARQVALYGPAHPSALEALADAGREIEKTARGSAVEVRATQDALVWNGSPLAGDSSNIGRFHAALRDRLIASITIAPGVRPERLAHLLLVLAAEPEEIASQGGVSAVFGESGSDISISEVDFADDVLVSEEVWRKLSEGIGCDDTGSLKALITACSGRSTADSAPPDSTPEADVIAADPHADESAEDVIAAGLARLIQRSGEALYFSDEAGWRTWRDGIAHQLAGLDPRWRSAIFRAPSSVSSECPDMLALIAATMNVPDCVSLVLDHPDSIGAERSDMLALALERILADPSRRTDIEAALHRHALERGVPEAVYQNVVGLLVARIEGKVGPEPQAAAVHQTLQRLDTISSPAVQQDLSDLLATTEPAAVNNSRLCLLREALTTPLTVTQYGTVISLLTRAAEECAAQPDAKGLVGVIASLGSEAEGEDPSRRTVALGALARASTDQVVSALAEGMDSAPQQTIDAVIDLLGLLGEPGLQHLIHIVQTGTDPRARSAMASLLKSDLPGLSHIRDLVAQAKGITLERTLTALLDRSNAQTADQIALACADASEEALLQVTGLIVDRKRTDLGGFLINLLDSPFRPVRLAAVDAVTSLDVREAAPALCDIVARESVFGDAGRLREAAVRALGALGEARAVPVLCRLLEGGAFLSKLGGRRARVAAAEALAALGGPDSQDALEQGARSLHPSVRDACRRALARLNRPSGQPPVGASHDR